MQFLKENTIFANDYLLLEQIGIGGFAEVWKARNMKADLIVALKVFIRLDKAGQQQAKEEFRNVFNLSHGNILTPSHFDIYEGQPFLVMTFCSKGNVLKLAGKMSEDEIMKLIYQISSSIEYIHALNPPLIHRDIKPDNFLIDDHGNYMLTDFGISNKIARTFTKSIAANRKTIDLKNMSSSGTAPHAYRAPELFSNDISQRKPTRSNDIFSFGVSIFEIATAEFPFGELGGILLLQDGIKTPDIPAPFSRSLNDLIASCLAKDPWDRPTATEIREQAQFYVRNGYWDMGTADSLEKRQQEYAELFRVFYDDEIISAAERTLLKKKQKELKLSNKEIKNIEKNITSPQSGRELKKYERPGRIHKRDGSSSRHKSVVPRKSEIKPVKVKPPKKRKHKKEDISTITPIYDNRHPSSNGNGQNKKMFFWAGGILFLCLALHQLWHYSNYNASLDNVNRQIGQENFTSALDHMDEAISSRESIIFNPSERRAARYLTQIGDKSMAKEEYEWGKDAFLKLKSLVRYDVSVDKKIRICDEKRVYTWKKTYGRSGSQDYGFGVAQDNEGHYYVVGQTDRSPTEGINFIMLKLDKYTGKSEWEKVWDGNDDDNLVDIKYIDANHFVVGGSSDYETGSDTDIDAFIGKIDKSGQVLWRQRYGSTKTEYLRRVAPTTGGGYVGVGDYVEDDTKRTKIYVIKAKSGGSSQWSRRFDACSGCKTFGKNVVQLKNGNFAVVANYRDDEGKKRYYLLVLSASGSKVWEKRGPQDSEVFGVADDRVSNTFTIGGTIEEKKISLLKFKYGSRNPVSSETFGIQNNNRVNLRDMIIDKNNRVISTGHLKNSGQPTKAFIHGVDANGNFLFFEEFSSSRSQHAYKVMQAQDNGYIIVGTQQNRSDNPDIHILKVGKDGKMLSN